MEEKNGLVKMFRNSTAQVLDFLIIHEGWDYNKTQIAEYSGITHKTIYDIWPVLEKYSLIKQTRTIGRMKMYSINKESNAVKQLKKLQTEIMFQALEKGNKKTSLKNNKIKSLIKQTAISTIN